MKPKKYKFFGHEYFRKEEVVRCLSDIVEESVRQSVATGNLIHKYNAATILVVKELFENL